MRLKEYLAELETCKDLERLFKEFRIHDNQCVLLRTNYDTLISDLLGLTPQQFRFHSYSVSDKSQLIGFIHGPVIMEVYPNVGLYDNSGERNTQRQLAEYNTEICLHPWNEDALSRRTHNYRLDMAQVSIILGEYAIKKRIPICFSHVDPPIEYKPRTK
ncbi:hypothetical protein J4467_01025 [Candidatus Woesearchaeota archaeon]|nr:hypothetical protein [Candidatus Woesearchaeota archaeon]